MSVGCSRGSSDVIGQVRRMCGLCRDLLNYPNLFPSRNKPVTQCPVPLCLWYDNAANKMSRCLAKD